MINLRPHQLRVLDAMQTVEQDAENLLATIDESGVDKILVCARRTAQIVNMVSETNFCNQLQMRGYNWMHITSKTGAIINGTEVGRDKFFDTLTKWGKERGMKFVVMHHTIFEKGQPAVSVVKK